MSRFLKLALVALVTGLMSTAADAQPFRDRGYHPVHRFHRDHPHFLRHRPMHHGDDRR